MFQPFVDKENSSQLGVIRRSRIAGPRQAPVGKTFMSSGSRLNTGPSSRRVLGDVNQLARLESIDHKLNLKETGGSELKKKLGLQLRPPAPASKPPKSRQQDRGRLTQKRSEDKAASPKVKTAPVLETRLPEVEDIEHMYIPEEEPDDFNDIWPLEEQPATYIEQQRNWRPTKLLPLHESDLDEEDDHIKDSDTDTDYPPFIRDDTLEDVDLYIPWADDKQVPSLSELPLPPLDDLFITDTDLYSGLL